MSESIARQVAVAVVASLVAAWLLARMPELRRAVEGGR